MLDDPCFRVVMSQGMSLRVYDYNSKNAYLSRRSALDG